MAESTNNSSSVMRDPRSCLIAYQFSEFPSAVTLPMMSSSVSFSEVPTMVLGMF